MAEAESSNLERRAKEIGAVVALAGLLFGVYQFTSTQAVESSKPFLERKLRWCEEAVETASFIAVHGKERSAEKVARFWQLYWGVMGMVENKALAQSMVVFGGQIDSTCVPMNSACQANALAIAHACRAEMAKDWSPLWRR